ncbi:MATE family efflux transporter [Hirschia baltica]|uniref:MATE efflux family protein n=1 Tax=Hirschia baltica (strain ATCC 49814 / DSM 5838 / IFAM 1418) TaxID=582402 RepID=C6XQJ3_HIRBI|nr:MATE family efflux transporter [Hirschia baltica]ACT58599.1 MATE efflux family protein [Hirschia baltica ATCC 49814]
MHSLPILTRKDVLSQAWPILLSQASIPLVGLVDTAIIGRTGDATELAGVALGASVIGFIFWSFGFLRMGVTGLTAQAIGADNTNEVQSILVRSVLIGCIIGAVLTILQLLFISTAFQILQAGPDVETAATGYASARFWGAPAILASYAINGWLLGLGKSKWALALQIITNSANILLDLYFVIELDMGAEGVGWGTAIAEWCALISGLIICAVLISKNGGLKPHILQLTSLLNKDRLKHMFAVNGNIMIRTMALLALLTWFANSGARQGEIQLAANHVLMQMLTVSAFVLDAFAVTAEARVGAAFGAKSKQHFWNAVKLTTEFAFSGALLAAIAIYFGGNTFIDIVVKNQEIVQTAKLFLPMAAAAPVLGVVAWQLDGIFIGTTNTAAMRSSTVMTLIIYIALDLALHPMGNWGVWIAFNASYVLRAITLGAFLPQLIHRIDANK